MNETLGQRPLIEEVEDGYKLPGLVDAHVHVESSHVRPSEFGSLLVRNGTMAAVCDPHEIVNVAGPDGLSFMLEDAKRSPASLFFALPSSVPATAFETSGAVVDAAETRRLFDAHPELVALAEVMNVPGVLARDPETMDKIRAALERGKRVDGHFPNGAGDALRAYASVGVTSDHESATAAEAREKVAAGMTVFIREGSSAKNLEAVLPAVDDSNWEKFCFCCDDISAADLAAGRGILDTVRKAVRMGLPPERAVAMASVNPIRHFGLHVDPEAGVVVRDLVDFEIVRVLPPRREPAQAVDPVLERALRGSVILPDLSGFRFPAFDGSKPVLAIGIRPTSLLTDRVALSVADGPPPARLAVIERHGKNGNIAYAPAVGAGPLHGAIATTVAHDSHNLVVLGDGDASMRVAAESLGRLGGGAVVVRGREVLAEMPLPLGGLMSDRPAAEVAAADRAVKAAAAAIGCTLPEPVTTLSFLALPVIPSLKLTDRGLFDVDAWAFA